MFSVNLHEFKPIQALDCINLNMTIHKYELLPGLIGAKKQDDDNLTIGLILCSEKSEAAFPTSLPLNI